MMASSNDPGSLPEVFGRYRIRTRLGSGTMGSVYLADDTQLQRQVALKVPRFDGAASSEMLERLYLEARSAANLRHPNICPVFDVGEIDGQHFISMAYIEGKTLAETLRGIGALQERQALLLTRKLALALYEAHKQGVVHRDLKPANVLIDAHGEPIVMDFGLALQTDRDAARLTEAGRIVGSPAYMAPEQIEGESSKLTAVVDQHALGVILFEMLTGELPYRGSISAVISQILMKPVPSPRSICPEIDARSDELCSKLLAKKPDQRFLSMHEVAERITSILKVKPATEPTKTDQPRSQAERPVIKPANTSLPVIRGRIDALIEKGELREALEIVKSIGATGDDQTTEWAKQKQQQIAEKIRERKKGIETLCSVAAKLIRKHDYAEAVNVLSSVPLADRTDELLELLSDAEDKEEESSLLLNDIRQAIANDQPKELSALVRRFLHLKPGNAQIRSLSEDLQKFGAEQVIRIRRRRQNYFDPAPPLFSPWRLTFFAVGILSLGLLVYFTAQSYAAPAGTVIVHVHDSRIGASFQSRDITAASSGQQFRLRPATREKLNVTVDGIATASPEIAVANRETKQISIRLIDGKVDLQITSDQPTFSTAEKDSPGQPDLANKNVRNTASSEPGESSKPPTVPWTDLLADTQTESNSTRTTVWNRNGATVVGTLKESAKDGWLVLVPPNKFAGDYDVEVDFLLVGSEYMQVGLPLNETVGTFSFGKQGTGIGWIEGAANESGTNVPLTGNDKLPIQQGVLQRFSASVRHRGDNVSIETRIGDVDAGNFEGARSRISTPKSTNPRSNQLKLVAQFTSRTAGQRFEVHAIRLRELGTGLPPKPVTPEETPKPKQEISSSEAPATRVVIDADFRKSAAGFANLDVDHMLTEHKNGEYRYVGKKIGWWWNGIEPAVGKKENSHLDDFTIEFDLRLVGKKKGSFVIQFGLAQKTDLCLCFDESGRIRLSRGGSHMLVPPTLSPELRAVDQFNTVRMTVENKKASVSVNGKPLFEKSLDQYVSKSIRIWLQPEEVPFDVRLQRLRLETPRNAKPRQVAHEVRKLTGHQAPIRGLAFLPDGERAISVGDRKAFKLWDVSTGKLIQEIDGHPADVTSVSISQDGRRALTGSADGLGRLWDLESFKVIKTLKGHARPVVRVILSRDAQTALTAADDGAIRRWDLKGGVSSKVVSGPGTGTTLGISADEKAIATSNVDGVIHLQGPGGVYTLTGHEPGAVGSIAFLANGSKLISAADDGTIRLWDLGQFKQIHRFDADGTGFDSMALTKDGRYVLGGNIDGKIYVWDIQTGDRVNEILAESSVTQYIALSPENRLVLSAGKDDQDLHLWQLDLPSSNAKR